MKEYYKILGLSEKVSEREIRSAYKRLAIRYHPDKNPDNIEYAKNKFIEIDTAFKVLSDPVLKLRYDNGISINDRDLRECQEKARKIFENRLFSENIEEIVNRLDNDDKKSIYRYVAYFYDNQEEFFDDLKNKQVDKIVEKMHTGVKVYFKRLTYLNIAITVGRFLWNIFLFYVFSFLNKVLKVLIYIF